MVLTRSKAKIVQSSNSTPFRHLTEKLEESGGKKVGKFPVKLWNLIESEKIKSIRWTKDGKAIGIDPRELQYELRVNSLGFKTANFSSFTRQLHLYGFRKINCETNYLEYKHPYFTKDRAKLAKLKRSKKRRSYSTSDEDSVPSSSGLNAEIKQEPQKDKTTASVDRASTHSDKETAKANREGELRMKYFGSVYARFDYYGKRKNGKSKDESTHWDDQFTEDLPADNYFF